MLRMLSKWLERRRRHRAAVAVAVYHFDSVTGKDAHAGISSVIGERGDGIVVRVCHGYVKPPGRAWFVVGEHGSVVAELSFADVQRFGEEEFRR
jgi:hypothetical protein